MWIRIEREPMRRGRALWALFAGMVVVASLRCQPEEPKHPAVPKTLYPKDPFASGGVLAALPADTKFAFKPGPPPPDQKGERVKIPFPPPASETGASRPAAPQLKPVPLRVVHHHPRGPIRNESAVTVTFNQPMVPLAALKDVKKHPAPLKVDPPIEARTRWLGVNTARYEVRGRLRYSTRYKVVIPAGTRATTGAALDKAHRWTFETPRLRLYNHYPSGESNPMDRAIVLVFNQRVDAAKVFAATRMVDKKSKRQVKLRLVPREQWATVGSYGTYALRQDKRKPGRVVVLKPLQKLQFRRHYRVTIKQGLQAGEGPLPTTQDLEANFGTWTYYPLRVTGGSCPYRSYRRKRTDRLRVRFNNPIKPKTEKRVARRVRVAPRVPGLKTTCKSYGCTLKGPFRRGVIYRVSVAPGVQDSYGQRLTKRWSRKCYLPHLPPRFGMPGSYGLSVLETRGPRQVGLHAVNLKSAQVHAVAVPLDKLFEARKAWGRQRSYKPVAGTLPGRHVKRTVRFGGRPDQVRKKSISLDRLLGKRKPGLVYVEAKLQPRFPVRGKISYQRRVYLVTDVGLAVLYDRHRLVVLVTSLQTGLPLASANVELFRRNGRRVVQGKTDARGLLEIKQPGPRGRSQAWTVFASHGGDRAFVDVWSMGWSRNRVARRRPDDHPFEARLRSLVFTERDPYRPGEKVHLTGVLRVEDLGLGGGLEPVRGRNVHVRFDVYDGRGRKVIKKQTASVDGDGVFTYSFTLPRSASLGRWRVSGRVHGTGLSYYRSFYKYFTVKEYRTPEYKVGVKFEGKPRFLGAPIRGEVTGRYFFGTALAGAPVRWRMTRGVGSYRPPNHDTFAFGDENPYRWSHWGYGYYKRRYHRPWRRRGWQVVRGKGKLDAQGRLVVNPVPKRFAKPYGPGTVGHVTLTAEVQDKSRQVIAASSTVIAHPASVYVGLRPRGGVLTAGKDSAIEVVTVDLKGKRVANRRVKLLAHRLVWPMGPRRWWYRGPPKEEPAGGCTAVTSRELALCKIVLPKAGQYVLRASTTDAKGRATRSVTYVYAVGPADPSAVSGRSHLQLVPDKKVYHPGEQVSLLIKSPYDRALGVLSVERSGIREYRVVRITSQLQLVKVKVSPRDIPNLNVRLMLVRGRDKRLKPHKKDPDPGAPVRQVASASIRISTDSKRLRVRIQATPSPARPGGSVTLKITTRDHQGKPARARLAVTAVDEGVLSLLGYKLPDPLPAFHTWRSARAATQSLRQRFVKLKQVYLQTVGYWKFSRDFRKKLKNGGAYLNGGGGYDYAPRKMAKSMARRPSEVSGDSAAPGTSPQFTTRANFASTALYTVALATDAQGQATHTFKLPDNLTTFRISAVAVGRAPLDRFGKGETQLTVRQPLMLMPALPRFANFGDRFEAAVKVTNESGKAGRVKVKLQAANALVIGPAVKSVSLKAGQTEEVRFPVAAGRPGRARFRFLAILGSHTDAVVKTIPVNLPATAQAFATYGSTTSAISQQVKPPANALAGFGGLDLRYASTALTGLEDAVRYLLEYPYGCTEQLSSRLLPLFALQKILPAFGLLGKQLDEGTRYAMKVPRQFLRKVGPAGREAQEKAYLRYMGNHGLARLLKHQRSDGGFGLWAKSRRSSPYLTAYATYTLLRAAQAGYNVPQHVLDNAAGWLGRYLSRAYLWKSWHWSYSLPTRVMAAWVASELRRSKHVSSWTRRRLALDRRLPELFKQWKRMPLFARAWLMVALHRVPQAVKRIGGDPVKTLLDDLDRAAIQDTPYRAHFREATTEGLPLLMHSNSRSDAIVLAALMEVKPDYPLTLKVVKGLLSARVRGRWESTQANAYALTALSAYFSKYEKEVPDFRVRAWLGRGFLGGTRFAGRSMKVADQRVPMAFLQRHKGRRLVVQKKGAGRLYYRLGLRYAPRSLRLKAESEGFTVQRRYEPVAGKGDLERLPDGRVRVKGGKLVRVRLTIKVPSRRHYVVVDDPLPAGFEIVDLSLKTSSGGLHPGGAGRRGHRYRYGWWTWNHTEKRDDRLLLFADRLWAGTYTYTYLARATTLGSFIAPPARAEEMYHPEVMGHTATGAVEVVK